MNLTEMLVKELEKPQISFGSSTTLSPSSSGVIVDEGTIGTCMRQVWFKHMGYAVSNPPSAYNKFNFVLGNSIEDWVIDMTKRMGIYVDDHVKVKHTALHLSGELDILIKNGRALEFIEVKSYNGSNYNAAKGVLGNKDNLPKPKDNHLLQVVTYLMMLEGRNIKTGHILYVDKSGASLYNNKHFKVYLDGVDIYYETLHMGSMVTLKEDRFTTKDIQDRNKVLLELIEECITPPEGYKSVYNHDDIEKYYALGEISKTKYNEYKKNPFTEIGSWQCAYCPYGQGDVDNTCKECS